MSAMLCKPCQKIFENNEDLLVKYYEDIEEFDAISGTSLTDRKGLEEGAVQNCQLCHSLWNLVLEQTPLEGMSPESNFWTIYSFHTLFYNNFLSVRYRILENILGNGPHEFPQLESSVVFWPQESNPPFRQWISTPMLINYEMAGTEIPLSPVAAVGLDPSASRQSQIFKWIHNCENEHTKCPSLKVIDSSIGIL